MRTKTNLCLVYILLKEHCPDESWTIFGGGASRFLCTQLYYIWFDRVLDGGRWYSGLLQWIADSRYKKGWKPLLYANLLLQKKHLATVWECNNWFPKIHVHYINMGMGVGRGQGGQGSPRIFKILATEGCFFSFEWKISNFTTFAFLEKCCKNPLLAPTCWEVATKDTRITQKWLFIARVQSRCYIIDTNNTGMGVRINFSIDSQSRHFARPFQAADDTTQMGVHIRLYPFYTTAKMTHVMATVPDMRFVGSKVS